jgi:hypothetical protein
MEEFEMEKLTVEQAELDAVLESQLRASKPVNDDVVTGNSSACCHHAHGKRGACEEYMHPPMGLLTLGCWEMGGWTE